MSEKMTKKSTTKFGFKDLKVVHKATCIALVTAAVLIAVCLVSDGMGKLGGGIRSLLGGLFSYGAVIIPIAFIAQTVGYADDLAAKRFGKRTLFAITATALISTIEYAIFTWGTEPVFAPAEHFININGGGFVGSLIGFALSSLIGQIGTIIISIAALAIYSVFFFGEKAGSIGQAALNVVDGIKGAISLIKEKRNEHIEKKKQIKEDSEQHQREVSSEQLIDDEFFVAKGEASEIKIKKLGIEENAHTHGLSPLVDPEKRVVEEPVTVPEPEIKHKKVDKPLDLSYGITEEAHVEAPASESAEKPKSERSEFGLDDSADSVFTRDFDPFDFATSEKKAAKYASKVSGGSAVAEELDEMTIYQMKADHEPDDRERRLMEFERKKQEWLRRKGGNSAPVTEATKSVPVTDAPGTSSSISSEPVKTEPVISAQPAPAISHTASEPSTSEAPMTSSTTIDSSKTNVEKTVSPVTDAYTPTYSSTSSRTQPIKTVEFTVSKTAPVPERSTPVVSTPTKSTIDPSASDEDIAILISDRVARENPAYARSANDLTTYTKVVSDGDDELYRQIEGISEPAESIESHPTESTAKETANSESVVEEPITVISSEPEAADEASGDVIVEDKKDPLVSGEPHENNEVIPETVEFTVTTDSTQPTSSIGYTIEPESDSINECENAEPVFKPYVSPTESICVNAPSEASDDGKLKVERSMLPPTPEAASSVSEVTYATADSSASTEITFSPSDEINEDEENDGNSRVFTDDDPIFTEVEDNSATTESSKSEEDVAVEINFDEDDEDEENEIIPAEEIPEEEIPEEDADSSEGEIPPEEQNPDVIKMRGMFNCLDPIDTTAASEPSIASEPFVTSEPSAAESMPEVAVPSEEADEPPFDDAVAVAHDTKATSAASPSVPSAALVPVNETKAEKKKDKPDYSDYKFPPLDLLARQAEEQNDNTQAEIQENADKLIETLASFGVTASIKGVDRGPRITRYEVVPAKGVKVSSILNLQDDIALNLAAGSIRMEAPIPGKSAVGIEIPNKNSSIVRLRDMLETPDFESEKSKTFVCIGRDVAGQPVFGDLAKMPHLLIAGATGMGKSVCINSLLISILYKARPDEVKLIMIDPKQVEFTMYNGIPHLLVPVVSDPKQAAGALMWAVEEMERRYNLLQPLCVRNIEAYNEKVTADRSLGDPMPKIIIVIDEFADLMLQVKDPVEQLVTRIAQKARAAGIHLVIGTQRPSVNVITGVIKANVPSRISCKVMSNVDSKTVLDSAGAEKLLDRGDALYAPAGSPKPHRLQCAFVADGEVEAIMNYLKEMSDGASYDSSVMEDIDRAAQRCSKKGGADRDDGDSSDGSGEGYLNDRQFLDAVEIAVNTRKISTSLIQRKMSIGYGKAAKFIDIMEDLGIVGPANGQRPREVIMTPDEWREKLSRSYID